MPLTQTLPLDFIILLVKTSEMRTLEGDVASFETLDDEAGPSSDDSVVLQLQRSQLFEWQDNSVYPISLDLEPSQRKHAACSECRKAKTGCVKGDPCERCLKNGLKCIFLDDGRAKRANRRRVLELEPPEDKHLNTEADSDTTGGSGFSYDQPLDLSLFLTPTEPRATFTSEAQLQPPSDHIPIYQAQPTRNYASSSTSYADMQGGSVPSFPCPECVSQPQIDSLVPAITPVAAMAQPVVGYSAAYNQLAHTQPSSYLSSFDGVPQFERPQPMSFDNQPYMNQWIINNVQPGYYQGDEGSQM